MPAVITENDHGSVVPAGDHVACRLLVLRIGQGAFRNVDLGRALVGTCPKAVIAANEEQEQAKEAQQEKEACTAGLGIVQVNRVVDQVQYVFVFHVRFLAWTKVGHKSIFSNHLLQEFALSGYFLSTSG